MNKYIRMHDLENEIQLFQGAQEVYFNLRFMILITRLPTNYF